MTKEIYCPCVLKESEEIQYDPSFMNKILHIGKKYYMGHIRWLLMNKKGIHISCDACGNIANGVIRSKILMFYYTIPLCKSHIAKFLKN